MDISESVTAALAHETSVTELFYNRFLSRHPEVAEYFAGVDLRQQAVLLLIALAVVEQYFQQRFPSTGEYLRILGARHEKMGIPTALYADWRECLLDTLQEFHGSDWNKDLSQEWTEAIDLASQKMLDGYETATV